jgi:hypothetical protein
MQYDSTVRNSEQTVVQFAYGDDGLNPQCMETTIKVNMDKQPKPVDVSVSCMTCYCCYLRRSAISTDFFDTATAAAVLRSV